MKDIQEDKYSDPLLNTQQQDMYQKLSFRPDDLYLPCEGDKIVTFDVCYDQSANVGIDIVEYPAKPVSIRSFKTAISGKYIPGYFSFYEGPVILKALEHLQMDGIDPALIIVDGHGLAHPRKFGLACFVGATSGKPVIGVAKESLLPFNNPPPNEQYGTHDFLLNNEKVGVAIRLQAHVKPVFISPGNRISLETSVDIIKGLTTVFRLPDNIRRADKASRSQ